MGWERKRGKLRELNRLLRGATDTSFVAPDRAGAPGALGHSLRDHARCRLAAAAGSGAETGRNDGPPAQPPRLRSGGPARGRRARTPAAAGHTDAARDGLGDPLPVRLLGPARHRPLCLRGLGRVPGPLRRGHLHGQGDLRRGRVRAWRWPTACRRTRSSPTISSRGSSLAPGSFRTSRSSKAFRVTTRWRSRASTAGSEVTGNCFPGCSRRAGPRRGPRASVAIPAIGRWKMIDNLRRSLSAPATFATLLAAWCLPGVDARLWTLLMLGAMCLPAILSFLSNLFPKRSGIAKRSFLRGVARDLAIGLSQAALRIVFLAHTAWMRSDAILRTLWRLAVSRRHLLEWVPAAQAHRTLDLEATGFYRRMRGGILLAAAAGALVAAAGSGAGAWAAPFVAAWLLSPLVARWISLPPREDASARFSPAGGARAARDRPPHLALLRAVRRSGVPRPAGRQLPGGAAAGSRAAHFADQHRARPALDRGGQRFRLDRDPRNARSLRRGPGRGRPPRALPRPPLQLVRNGRPHNRSSRATCPRSTAATWPPTC